MKCLVCGKESLLRVCSGCGRTLEPEYALRKASGVFYNQGLAYAKEHRLEHARQALKKAVVYNPENQQALNLLGVVWTQNGEIGEAVKCWLRSVQLDPVEKTNPAVDYLRRTSRSIGKAASMKEAVRLYNQGLNMFQAEQIDSALIHLKKAAALSEHFVKPRSLLAIYYMREHQWNRSAEMILQIEHIDPEEPSLPHLKELLLTAKEEWEKSKAGKMEQRRAEELPPEEQDIPDPQATQENKSQAESKAQGLKAQAENQSVSSASGTTAESADDEKAPLLLRKGTFSWKSFFAQNGIIVQMLLFFTGFGIGLLFMKMLLH